MFSISLMNKMPRMSCLFKSFKREKYLSWGEEVGGGGGKKEGIHKTSRLKIDLDYLPRNTVYVYMNIFD